MSVFEKAVRHTLGIEGGFSDHPHDTGGATRWGITERVARQNGYNGDMRHFPIESALLIYRRDYWDKMNLDLIAPISERVAIELFDSGVNMGTGYPQTWLQRILNVANRMGDLYPDLSRDGVIGPMTAAALRSLIEHRGQDGEEAVFQALNGFQSVRYTVLAERREANESFWFGWHSRRVQ